MRYSGFSLRFACAAAFCLLIFGCNAKVPPAKEQGADQSAASPAPSRSRAVVVYSSVSVAQMEPALDAFTAETGIKVQLLSGDYPDLANKLVNHGRDPVADLLVGDSLASLAHAAENDLLRPTYADSADNDAAGPLSDPEKMWFPLGIRARLVIFNTNLVSDTELAFVTDYSSLRDRSWQERLCLSSSKVSGNRLLIAALIREHGEREAELIVRSWLRNMGEKYYRDDMALLQAVAAGDCQVAIADSSALATLTGADRNAPLAPHRFPAGATVQVDISGAGVTRHAQNPSDAAVLLQWLNEETPNALFAASGYEFPINDAAATIASIDAWSDFVANPMAVSQLSFFQEEAVRLAERARYP